MQMHHNDNNDFNKIDTPATTNHLQHTKKFIDKKKRKIITTMGEQKPNS